MSQDPFEAHLQKADAHFAAGEVVPAGQIWQAVLKRDPQHARSREGLLKVKEILDRQKAERAAAAPPPVPVAEPRTDPSEAVDLLVRQGATLYDMGQSEDALVKWEEALALAPGHDQVLVYINLARKEMGLPPLGEEPRTPAPAPKAVAPTLTQQAAAPREEVEVLLRQASQLYDMGVTDEAILKWERVLALDPDNGDAKAYLALAAKDQQQAPPPPAPERNAPTVAMPQVAQAATTAMQSLQAGGLELRLAQAERLVEIGRRDEAVYAFQLVLQQDPGNGRALEGLARAQAQAAGGVTTEIPVRSAGATISLEAVEVPAQAPAVAVPAAVTAAQPRRSGLQVPPAFQELASRPWFRSPWVWGGAAAALSITVSGVALYRGVQRDRQLRADVAAARAAASGPVARATAVADIAETPASILAEGRGALSEDPLRAYHRAKELLRRDPTDAPGAQLLEQAKAALAKPAEVEPSPAALDAKLKAGDLDSADQLLDALLRTQPEDPDLMRRAGRLLGTLAQLRAAKGRWREAKDVLLRGRALFPQDKGWTARLRLLEHIEAQPKAEQPGWIALLG